MKSNTVILDGATGTMLQETALKPGELPERLNLKEPETVIKLHKSYFDAGSNVVASNTFGANPLKYGREELEAIIRAGVQCVAKARDMALAEGKENLFIALDMGPTGKLLKPYGDLDFEDAVKAFAEVVKIGASCGADLVMLETFSDSYETKAALLAVKENCSLPVIVSNSYGEDGRLLTGAMPEALIPMLEGLGADAVGINCSYGPDRLSHVINKYLECSELPVVLKPNAGLPSISGGKPVFDIPADLFAEQMISFAEKGVKVLGGCCGTTPEYIKLLADSVRENANVKAANTSKRPCHNRTVVSSFAKAVEIGKAPVLIGERINPTGKKRFKQALTEHDIDFIVNEGITQEQNGAHLLDVNVGLPGIDEPAMLEEVTENLMVATRLPLQIDTANPAAMERALRRYNGKPMINSVNGRADSMEVILPLAAKYGGVVVALCLDEKGIPETSDGRLLIARRIVEKAESLGINRRDIVFDALTMAVSAEPEAAETTLSTLHKIKTELGCKTVLGVSNVSFGLPDRENLNARFLGIAMGCGLDAAIANVNSEKTMEAYRDFVDGGCVRNFDLFIEKARSFQKEALQSAFEEKKPAGTPASGGAGKTGQAPEKADGGMDALRRAVIKGLKDESAAAVKSMIGKAESLDIINNGIIPALNEVGAGFEKGTMFLPQLLLSAASATAAFDVIKASYPAGMKPTRCPFVIATVEGDIHDIGKNIVKLLLENYGFDVTDLGRNVPAETVLEAALRTGAPIVGLSALMTTTVPAMEKTVKLLHEKIPGIKVIVGGAVLTEEYARTMGADFYGGDAINTVRIASSLDDKMKG